MLLFARLLYAYPNIGYIFVIVITCELSIFLIKRVVFPYYLLKKSFLFAFCWGFFIPHPQFLKWRFRLRRFFCLAFSFLTFSQFGIFCGVLRSILGLLLKKKRFPYCRCRRRTLIIPWYGCRCWNICGVRANNLVNRLRKAAPTTLILQS